MSGELTQSVETLLSGVRLRVDAQGQGSAALLVEGPTDKKLFNRWALHPSLVVPCGGKGPLMAALAGMNDDDRSRMLILRDCDYDVAAERLVGGRELVITERCDVEADLVAQPVLEMVVDELLPRPLTTAAQRRDAAKEIRARSIALAQPLGRLRAAVQVLGVDLELEDFRFHKHRLDDGTTDLAKMARTIRDRLDGAATLAEVVDLRDRWPDDEILCNGKDLLRAMQFVLHSDFGSGPALTADVIAVILRAGLDRSSFESWSVVKRIRRWEGTTGRLILA